MQTVKCHIRGERGTSVSRILTLWRTKSSFSSVKERACLPKWDLCEWLPNMSCFFKCSDLRLNQHLIVHPLTVSQIFRRRTRPARERGGRGARERAGEKDRDNERENVRDTEKRSFCHSSWAGWESDGTHCILQYYKSLCISEETLLPQYAATWLAIHSVRSEAWMEAEVINEHSSSLVCSQLSLAPNPEVTGTVMLWINCVCVRVYICLCVCVYTVYVCVSVMW